MSRRLAGRWLGGMVVLIGLLIPTSSVLAATAPGASPGVNLTISPAPLALSVNPGHSVSADIRVQNNNAEAETIQVGLMKFSADGETGEPQIENFSSSDSYQKWATFSQSQLVIPPNGANTVHMTINVPQSAAFGYYYAVTFSQVNASQSGDNPTPVAHLNGSAADLVLLAVNSPYTKRIMQLADFTANHKIYSYLPSTFTVRVRNTGNIFTAPIGNIFITKGSNKNKIATLNVNQGEGYVLPGTYRAFTASWKDGWPLKQPKIQNGVAVSDSKGDVKYTTDWNNFQVSKIRFGKYTAHLVFVYNNGTEEIPLEAAVSFYVIPWPFVLVVAVILFIIGADIFLALRGVGRGVAGIRHKR